MHKLNQVHYWNNTHNGNECIVSFESLSKSLSLFNESKRLWHTVYTICKNTNPMHSLNEKIAPDSLEMLGLDVFTHLHVMAWEYISARRLLGNERAGANKCT